MRRRLRWWFLRSVLWALRVAGVREMSLLMADGRTQLFAAHTGRLDTPCWRCNVPTIGGGQ